MAQKIKIFKLQRLMTTKRLYGFFKSVAVFVLLSARNWIKKAASRLRFARAILASCSSEQIILKLAPEFTLILGIISLCLCDKYRREILSHHIENRAAYEQIENIRVRVRSVIAAATETINFRENQEGHEDELCTNSSTACFVDLESLLEAINDLFAAAGNDSLVGEGLQIALVGVKHNLTLALPTKDSKLSSDLASLILKQLEYLDDIQSIGRKARVSLRLTLSKISGVVFSAKKAIRKRQIKQLTKAFLLFDSAKWQIPYLVASSALQIVDGWLFAVKGHFINEIVLSTQDQIQKRFQVRPSKDHRRTVGGTLDNLKLLLAIELISLMNNFISRRLKEQGLTKFVRNLETQLFRSLLTQDLSFFENRELFEIRQMIATTEFTCESIFSLPVDLVNLLSRMIACTSLSMARSKELTVLLMALLPLKLAIETLLKRVQDRIEGTFFVQCSRDTLSYLWKMIGNPVGIRTIRSFGREPIEVNLFSQSREMKSREKLSSVVYDAFSSVDTLLEKSIELLTVSFGSYLALGNYMNVADITSFTGPALQAFNHAQMIFYMLQSLMSHTGVLWSAEKMYDLLHSKPTIGIDHPPIGSMPTEAESVNMEWGVSMKGVHFAYPGMSQKKILTDISFEVAAGERVGVLGESGCGKSTLAALITRLYDANAGQVLVCGRDVRDFNPIWLRRHVAVVAQSTFLPFCTVRENLLYGFFRGQSETAKLDGVRHSGTDHGTSGELQSSVDAELRSAMRLARCEDLFFNKERFPQTWHSDIGQNGSRLSGGERQRLCIARAILTRPRVLILDEATSALDEETQYQVQESLQNIYEASDGKLTIITIAHRMSNFRYVDKVIVMADGSIKEQGTTAELSMDRNGIFSRFLDLSNVFVNDFQTRGYQKDHYP